MKNYWNRHAFALILAMWLVIFMVLIAFFILEYMIPFSRNTKGIENASRAYYQAESGIEEALYFVNSNILWSEEHINYTSNTLAYKLDVTASWTILPKPWEGNSEFKDTDWNTDWNIIRSWDPIQLEIWNNEFPSWNFSAVKFFFKVPDLNPSWSEVLAWWTSPIINWQLSSDNNSLNATGSWIYAGDINVDLRTWVVMFNWSSSNVEGIKFNKWIDLDGNPNDLNWASWFYASNCWVGSWCTLKMSVINKLRLTDWTPVPYIEWKIETWTNIPLRYTIIETSWKSYGFKKDLKVKVPQQTVNEAFDFTVFQ